MHFRKKSPCQFSLDEPYSNKNNEDAKQIRRELGTRDDRLVGCVTRLALARAISELPEGYRTIFLLHEVEGYEHHEIAELLGCSVGNSKSQLHKAKLRIRDFLARRPREARAETCRNDRPSTTPSESQCEPLVEKWMLPIPPAPRVNMPRFAPTTA
jgi:RNA polymerase sigma-70 factor (ECF subfamily)